MRPAGLKKWSVPFKWQRFAIWLNFIHQITCRNGWKPDRILVSNQSCLVYYVPLESSSLNELHWTEIHHEKRNQPTISQIEPLSQTIFFFFFLPQHTLHSNLPKKWLVAKQMDSNRNSRNILCIPITLPLKYDFSCVFQAQDRCCKDQTGSGTDPFYCVLVACSDAGHWSQTYFRFHG